MTTSANPDIDALLPVSREIVLSTGTRVDVQDLKTRQFFKLLRIVTNGAGPMLADLDLSTDQSPDEFAAKMLGIVILAVPNAEDEAIEFMRESKDIQSLGKRLASMFQTAQKTGQLKPSEPSSRTSESSSSESSIESTPTDSSEASHEPLTSSVPSTDGPTSESST
jgi:hypothetical protein